MSIRLLIYQYFILPNVEILHLLNSLTGREGKRRKMIVINLLFLTLLSNVRYCLTYYLNDFIIGVVTGPNGEFVERSFNAALEQLNLTSITINEVKWIRGSNGTVGDICDSLVTQSGQYPSLIFDFTPQLLDNGNGQFSTVIKKYSRQSGTPMVSTSLSLEANKNPWNHLNSIENNYLIHLYRPGDVIPMIIQDIITLYNITEAAILHDQSFILDHKLTGLLDKSTVDYDVKQLDFDNLENTMNELKASKVQNYFVLAKITNIDRILEKASRLGMFRFADSWFMITKGRGQIKCENCTHGSVLFYQPARVKSIEYSHSPGLNNIAKEKRVDAFFIYDLVRLTLMSVDEMVKTNVWPIDLTHPDCGKSLTAHQFDERKGLNLRDQMSLEGFFGLYGQFVISPSTTPHSLSNQLSDGFDQFIDYQEIIMRVTKVELWSYQPFRYYLVSEWIAEPPRGRFISTGAIQAASSTLYKIVTIQQPPFVMRWPNGTWYGYCIDLLESIQDQLAKEDKFDYELYECPDGKYGDKDPQTGKWDGIMGEIQSDKAQIGIGSVTVMAERESVVDFTVPYYDLVGISILMKKTTTPSHMFKFLTVLTNEVWLSVLICYLATSASLFILDRLSPYSYRNMKNKPKDSNSSRDFNLRECFWFCMTSLTPQGGGDAPVNLSGRFVAAVWWIFGFVLVATYTANLAAFLTVSRLDSPIDGLDKLVEQYRIRYAPVKDTLSMIYFKRMAYIEKKFYEIWKDMALDENLDKNERSKLTVWDYPLTQKYSNILKQIEMTGMPKTFEEGVARVKRSKNSAEGFTLLADATKIRYAAMTNCDIQQVGNEFSRKPIALAVQENSPLKDKLSSAILKLLNQRKLETLKEKWWSNNPERKQCEDPKKASDGISIRNIGGVFIVISVGVVLACITLIWEHCIVKRFRKSSAKVSNIFRQEIGNRETSKFYNFPMPYNPKMKAKI